MKLKPVGGRAHQVEVRARPELGCVRLELHRSDCKEGGGPVVTLSLDEARELLRGLQGARDEAYRLAKLESKRKQDHLERTVDRVARALEATHPHPRSTHVPRR